MIVLFIYYYILYIIIITIAQFVCKKKVKFQHLQFNASMVQLLLYNQGGQTAAREPHANTF